MEPPIVLCGFGRIGSRVLEYLHSAGLPAVVIDTIAQPDDPRLLGARLIRGDCRRREVLEEAGIAEARGVLILTRDDLLNVSTALLVRAINKDVRIVLRMFNQNLLARLGKAVSNVFALSTSLLTAPALAMTVVTGQVVGTFRVEGLSGDRRDVAELLIRPGSPLRGRTLGSICKDVIALSHSRVNGTERFLVDIDPSERLEGGDRVVLCGQSSALAPLLRSWPDNDAGKPGWGTSFFRLLRIIKSTFSEIDTSVKVCATVLLVVLVVSTLVLHIGVYRDRLHLAFLRTVSIMATGSGLHEDEYADSPRIMFYTSVLRLVGAALVAAFTAIVTDYLIRARLRGVFEVRRIPETGHYVICGLNSIGFRLVEELIALKKQVAIVEQDATNRFVITARRLGAAVIVGDAGVSEVLRQANTGTAQGVIATTDNDMTNLEVGLLARELNPRQRVVLLLNDPQFAGMLREAAGIQFALSVPALAAPAFVAALFGDRVAGVFFLGDRLHAAVDLVINPNDPWVSHAVRAVAYDYRLQPLALIRPDGQNPGPLTTARLGAGDRLVAIVALSDLERLFRRQPCSAECAVEVTSVPIPTRAWLVGLARTLTGRFGAEADVCPGEPPFLLASGLTEGQARDLLAQLDRERVSARIRRLDSTING
jgi:Trk K+ transport system NAD-binding subunit